MVSGRQIGGMSIREKSKFQIPKAVAKTLEEKLAYYFALLVCVRVRRLVGMEYAWHTNIAAFSCGDVTDA